MKTFFAFLAVCLVAVNAAVVPEETITDYQVEVDNVLHEMTNIAVHTAQALEHQLEEIILEPLQQVEEAVQSIDVRKLSESECVEAEEPAVIAAVDAMHDELNVCGIVAAQTSASIVNDVNAATQQLVFGGYGVMKMRQKCKNCKNSFVKSSCYTRLSLKVSMYLLNARKSIKTIRQSTNERVPAVFVDSSDCTHTASDKAVNEIGRIHDLIDDCVSRL